MDLFFMPDPYDEWPESNTYRLITHKRPRSYTTTVVHLLIRQRDLELPLQPVPYISAIHHAQWTRFQRWRYHSGDGWTSMRLNGMFITLEAYIL